MKTLTIKGELKSQILKVRDTDDYQDYIIEDLIISSLAHKENPAAASGFDAQLAIIELIKKIKTALAEDRKTLLIENAEHAIIVKAIKNWVKFLPVLDPGVFDWVNSIISLPDEKVETIKDEEA